LSSAQQQLVDETRGLAGRVERVFKLILRFCAVQDKLRTRVDEEAGAWALRRRQAALESKEARWGLAAPAPPLRDWKAQEREEARAMAGDFSAQVDVLTGEYAAAMADLVQRCVVVFFGGGARSSSADVRLRSLSECASENLRFLALRLDFNLFYVRSAA